MNAEQVEAEAMKLDVKARARLAGLLLESLESLSPEENERIWAEEAERRSAALDAGTLKSRPAEDVFRDAQARL